MLNIFFVAVIVLIAIKHRIISFGCDCHFILTDFFELLTNEFHNIYFYSVFNKLYIFF